MTTSWLRALGLALALTAVGSLTGCSSSEEEPEPGAYLAISEEVERQYSAEPRLEYVRVVEMFSGEEVLRTKPVEGGSTPVWWSPNGRHLVTYADLAGDEAGIRVIDFPSGKVHGPEPVDLHVFGKPAWSPDGKLFAMGLSALGVFDAKGRLLFQSEEIGTGAAGSFTIGRPEWSPDGEHVLLGVNTTIFIASRNDVLVTQDIASVEDDGPGLPAGTWAIGGTRWLSETTFEVRIVDLYTGRGIAAVVATGTLDGDDVAWAGLEELSDPFEWRGLPEQAPEVDLQAAVPDGDFSWDSSGAFPPFKTADGGSWVYQAPGGPNHRLWQTWPFAVKLVVFNGDRTGVVEMDSPFVVGLVGAGAGDVVVVRGKE